MNPLFEISEVQIRLVGESADGIMCESRSFGIIGWASCVLNGSLFLNNIVIKQTKGGKVVLKFPARKNESGVKYFHFNPITLEAYNLFRDTFLKRMEQDKEKRLSPNHRDKHKPKLQDGHTETPL